MQPFIEGVKICLRAMTREDIPSWSLWFNNPDVTRNMNKGVFPNTEQIQEEFYTSISKSRTDIQLGIMLKETHTLVGLVGIHKIDWIHRKADISILIGEPEAWGKKIGEEATGLAVKHAFEQLNMHKLTAGMWASNISSRKVFEKNGFVREGILKEQYWDHDQYVDELRYGLLKKQWLKLLNKKE